MSKTEQLETESAQLPRTFQHWELYVQRLNNEPEYAIKRITLNKYTIELIENPTPAMKRLHAMRWKI